MGKSSLKAKALTAVYPFSLYSQWNWDSWHPVPVSGVLRIWILKKAKARLFQIVLWRLFSFGPRTLNRRGQTSQQLWENCRQFQVILKEI